MSKLTLRIRFNEGRAGVKLSQLSAITSSLEKFLESFTTDLGVRIPAENLIAQEFKNESVSYAVEASYDPEVFTPNLNIALNSYLKSLNDVSKKFTSTTNQNFKNLISHVPNEDKIKFTVYDSGREIGTSEIRPADFEFTIDNLESSHHFQLTGSVYAIRIGDSKASEFSFQIREEISKNLITCITKSEKIYNEMIEALKDRNLFVIVEGMYTEFTDNTKKPTMEVLDFRISPEFDLEYFEKMLGTKPNLLGNLTTNQYLNSIRGQNDE